MTKVKICGITNIEDAVLAVKLGADALGFNFYQGSTRFISPAAARTIIDQLPSQVKKVGIFVASTHDHIISAKEISRIDAIQLHGRESAAFVKAMSEMTGAELIYAFPVTEDLGSTDIGAYGVKSVLLDSLESGQFGGSGTRFNWSSAAGLRRIVETLYLAGGLTPENVVEAIEQVKPDYVDVASGVEAEKGKKDPKKLEAFIKNAKKT